MTHQARESKGDAEGRGRRVLKFLSKVVREADNVFEKIVSKVFQKEENPIEFSYKDAVIMGLLENIINHTKSLNILIENNHHSSLDSILRTIFENYVYLRYILRNDTEIRAKSYMYSTRISEFQMVDKLKEQSLTGRKLRDLLHVSLEEIDNTYKSKIDPARRERIEKFYIDGIGMQHLNQKWYNPDGKSRKLKNLCKNLGLEAEYEFIYSILSKEAHGKDAIDKLDIQKYLISVKKSNEKDTELHISLATIYLIEIVREIYMHYGLKEELKHFNTMLKVHKTF